MGRHPGRHTGTIRSHPAAGRDRTEGEEVSETFSRTVFVVEADRKPILAVAAKKHLEAEAFFVDERVQAKLKSLHSSGEPLCDDSTILHIRLAHADERARYHGAGNATRDRRVIFLVNVDEVDSASLL